MAGGGLGHLEISSRAVHERPAPQATIKITDCSDDPQAPDVMLTRMAHLADKTPPFGSGHCIGAVFLGELQHVHGRFPSWSESAVGPRGSPHFPLGTTWK